jgi:DNA adenine methylase
MTTTPPLKAPFPWFGGKSRAADLIWPRLGNPINYVEPFAGSLAVLLRRPGEPTNEIINDLDCYVANAWRAVKNAPAEVAEVCDWPVNEADLHARHRWLHSREEFRKRMEHEPDFYDVKIAGFWIWGLSCWIGDNFCRPKRHDSLPHLTGGQGVARQVPHLTGGKGEFDRTSASSAPDRRSRCRSESSARRSREQTQNLQEWFQALAARLRFTKVCCGDWSRVLTKASTYGQGLTGVLLDPPYDTDGHDDVYGELSRGVSGAVREWAITNGPNPLLRIALCGYEGEHQMPDDWSVIEWKATGGFGNQSGNENAKRERIWFSPHCANPEPELFK